MVYIQSMKYTMFKPQVGEMAGGNYIRQIVDTAGITSEELCAIQGPIVKVDQEYVWIEGWNRTVRILQAKAYIVKTKR
jgi:hypothetical protein